MSQDSTNKKLGRIKYRDKTALTRAEAERVLRCIASNADHYTVLKVSRDATSDEIRSAYREAVECLHPLKCKDVIEEDGAMRWKLSQAILRVVEAFSALSRPARRLTYDGSLNWKPPFPLPLPPVPDALEQRLEPAPEPQDQPSSNKRPLGNAFGHPTEALPLAADRRKAPRLIVRIPVVVGSSDGSWLEKTETFDLSKQGMKVRLSRKVKPGAMLDVELRMPKTFRTSAFTEPLYNVKAVVRHVQPGAGEATLVGVEFLH